MMHAVRWQVIRIITTRQYAQCAYSVSVFFNRQSSSNSSLICTNKRLNSVRCIHFLPELIAADTI